MASLQLAVEDSSPLISYTPAGAWVDTPADDPLISSYSGGSFHTSSESGASATITFNGTGISIFGGNRPTYGSYDFSVDGVSITSGNAQSLTPSFNQTLGTASGLPSGLHIAVLTNTGSPSSLDIDWLQFDTGTEATNTTIDDTSPLVSYEPSSDWQTNNREEFVNGTAHFTSIAGASASLNFSGDAVAIYGSVSPDHADIKVTLDNEVVTFGGGSGGFSQHVHPKTLLFFRNNLDSHSHNLVVSADPRQGTGPFLDIDSFSVYKVSTPASNVTSTTSATIPAGTSIPTTQGNGSPPKNSHKVSLSKAAVIGTACAAAVTVAILILVLILLRRVKRHRSAVTMPMTPVTPALPIQSPDMGFDLPYTFARRFKGLSHSYAPSQDSDFSSASNMSEDVLVSNTPPVRTAQGMDSTGNVNRQPKRPARRPPALQLTVM